MACRTAVRQVTDSCGYLEMLQACKDSHADLFVVISKRSSDLQAGVLVGVMDDDVVAISGDVHCREEVRTMQ